MCGSRKYPYPLQGRSLEILRRGGGGGQNCQNEKYEAKLEIPGERGGMNTGFSASFRVDGRKIKGGGYASKCHRQQSLGSWGHAPPEKFQNL